MYSKIYKLLTTGLGKHREALKSAVVGPGDEVYY